MRVSDADHARFGGAAEVVADDAEAAARGVVGVRIERQDDRRPLGVGVHGQDDARGQDPLHERHELLGHAAEDDPRIARGIDRRQVEDALRRLDDVAAGHRLAEEGLLRLHVPQQRRGGDSQLRGDVGQGGGVEALQGEDTAGRLQDLIAVDACRASHL